MTTATMTVHEALAELKMLDHRILKAIENANFAVVNKHANTRIDGKTVATFVEDAGSAYQRICDLTARRKAIKHALSLSNAVTKVSIAGKEYTVAEAIEMKRSGMELKKSLLCTLEAQLNQARRAVEKANHELAEKADLYVTGLFGSKEKVSGAEASTVREAYITANTAEVVALHGIETKMEALNAEVAAFESEVDSRLSISNALTTITITY